MRPLERYVKEVLLRGGLLAHKAAGTGLAAWIAALQEPMRSCTNAAIVRPLGWVVRGQLP
jgi:hypothetical protein